MIGELDGLESRYNINIILQSSTIKDNKIFTVFIQSKLLTIRYNQIINRSYKHRNFYKFKQGNFSIKYNVSKTSSIMECHQLKMNIVDVLDLKGILKRLCFPIVVIIKKQL